MTGGGFKELDLEGDNAPWTEEDQLRQQLGFVQSDLGEFIAEIEHNLDRLKYYGEKIDPEWLRSLRSRMVYLKKILD